MTLCLAPELNWPPCCAGVYLMYCAGACRNKILSARLISMSSSHWVEKIGGDMDRTGGINSFAGPTNKVTVYHTVAMYSYQ